MKRPLYRDLSYIYSDFKERELTVAMMNYWPFFYLVKGADASVPAVSGRGASVLNVVADSLNFT